jgi:DNA polymerase delta subunit 1
MPAAVLQPQKRILGDSTKLHSNNLIPISPTAVKRRKLNYGAPAATNVRAPNGGRVPGSSQPKSQFEEEVLEKLTQDINGLKQKNAEKDQQWDRPPLDDFDENRDNLCFQQIEVEEGTLHGGRPALKLFGVTEV